jgi:thymidylate synthase
MHILWGRNVNELYFNGCQYLALFGALAESRNGPVYVAPGPVASIYKRPEERVLFNAKRDANPFFHLIESLWILAGRDDVASLAWLVSGMARYSDNGSTFNAPYGYRLRRQWGDQLEWAITLLKRDRSTRRAAITISNPLNDQRESKDVACNLSLAFSPGDENTLNLVVFCRSNDILWGAYGTNAVQMSMIHEYVARAAHFAVGEYTQVSVNFHAYVDVWEKHDCTNVAMGRAPAQPYPDVVARPIWNDYESREDFDWDLRQFWNAEHWSNEHPPLTPVYRTVWFNQVAEPMRTAYWYHKHENYLAADVALNVELPCDWIIAGREWLARRYCGVTP